MASDPHLVYLDHAATTPVDPRVLEAMLPYWSEKFGNPSSVYSLGREAAGALRQAREQVAEVLNCRPEEVYFTSGGTEADNAAIRGIALAQKQRRQAQHIITSAVEHHAVLHTCQWMEKHLGFEVTYLPVDANALVAPEDVRAAIRPDTALISIMYANNEVGTIEPVEEIAAIAREHKVPFHTDAVQAGGLLSLDVEQLGVASLSLSAHKFYGPKGVGVLYLRRGTPFVPVQTGGGQERNRRAGTENVAGAVGLATALVLAQEERESEAQRLAGLRDQLIEGVLQSIPDSRLTGHPERRLPNSASFVISFIEGESMLLSLDMEGIAASSGSACTSGSLEPSAVLTAMGLPPELAHGSLRLTLGHSNTEAQVQRVIEVLPGIVERLRAMSPLAPGRGAERPTH
ncbi:MAG: cysteine desulfurase NifS [Anaerolineae bacterium]|nr:cysteine desulfurase NifS [Anaerolineae bacterium]